MKYTLLATIEDTFEISGIGTVIDPNFPVPDGRWNNIDAPVQIRTPEGDSISSIASFTMTHFKLTDHNARADQSWRIVIALKEVDKERISKGSQLLIPADHSHLLRLNQGHRT